jgi:hypothetical protein
LFSKWSLTTGGWARLCVTALVCLVPALGVPGGSTHAGDAVPDRKVPMRFMWHQGDWRQRIASRQDQSEHNSATGCMTACGGWVSAVGTITGDTPKAFDEFADGRDLKGATIVLDSSGGSVLDTIKLGRQWRDLGVMTAVGVSPEMQASSGGLAEPYCESMCVFLLLSGKTRYVPVGAHIRVHQIWMGDRADDAKAASYTAQDVMIIERDVGRLAKYTFDMGGAGDLLSLALSIPPWETLHELTQSELRLTNLATDDAVAAATPSPDLATIAHAGAKPIQDRFAGSALQDEKAVAKTAEATGPTGAALQSSR